MLVSQAQLQNTAVVPAASYGYRWNIWQICAIVIFVSIAVNFATPHLLRLLNFVSTWLLQQIPVAWSGISISTTRGWNDTVTDIISL